MSNSKFLKDPVLRNKYGTDLENPCGDILEEVKDLEKVSQVGGWLSPTITSCPGLCPVSWFLGNEGGWCTLSLECQGGECHS